MLQAFVITLREGLEAFLIVAISLAYLRKSGREELAKAVHWGIAVAVAVSAGGGYLLSQAANQEWLDGPLALAPCVSRLSFRKCDDCPDLATCAIREALLRARDATASVLESYSLADAAAGSGAEIFDLSRAG